MNRLAHAALAAALLLVAACGDTSSSAVTALNLDRPVDIAFACYGGLRLTHGGAVTAANRDDLAVTAMPSAVCDNLSLPTVSADPTNPAAPQVPAPALPGQEDETANGGQELPVSVWYALILQQGPGTVALAQFKPKPTSAFAGGIGVDVKVLDTDPFTPGKNGISIGEDPLAIVTDQTGCFAVTANAGSYDLSTLELNTAFDSDPDVNVTRLEVKNASGTRIAARPAAMAVPPQTPVIGNECPATATGLVYVAYPGCRLVAGIDVSTGTVTHAIQYDMMGVPTLLDAAATATITCPDESIGEPALAGTRPVTLDIELDTRSTAAMATKMAIGANNSGSVTVVEMSNDGIPQTLRQIALENPSGKLGVTDVAIAPVIGEGGSRGDVVDDGAPGGDFQYIYAVTNDDTVRVMDVNHLDRECDTQLDPRFLTTDRSIPDLQCLPIGDPARPRRSGAKGPGIELIGDAVPNSIDIVRADKLPVDSRVVDPGKLIGYFAYITARSGSTFVVTVDDDNFPDLFENNDPLQTPIPLAIANQLRDSIVDRGLQAATEDPETDVVTRLCSDLGDLDSNGTPLGGPRASAAPVRALPTGTIATEKVSQLPTIRQELCGPDPSKGVLADTAGAPVSTFTFNASIPTRYTTFPDIRGLRGDEDWSIAWEGILSRDNATVVDGPPVRESLAKVDGAGLHMIDQTTPFCDAGVEKGDFVQFRGCDPSQGDSQCPTGYRCYTHPDSQVTGLGSCMLTDEAERLAAACKPFLTTFRRYTVDRADSGELLLLPRRHELRTTPVDGCTDAPQCKALADYGARTLNSSNPKDDTTTADPSKWACVKDPLRADKDLLRCEAVCETQSDCQAGLFCQDGGDGHNYCMESVIPPQACVNAPQRYELHAGEAFTVIGSRTGYVHPIIADASGKCVVNMNADRLQIGRFGLEPRAAGSPTTIERCDPAADPVTGALPGGGFEPNPCAETVNTTDIQPRYTPGTCTPDPTNATAIVTRPTQSVKFRNRQFNMDFTDVFYPGDQSCVGDRLGPNGVPLQKVPLAFGGFEVDFHQLAGFAPLVVPIQPAFPVKVVRGPTNSVWIIDNGDFLSTSTLTPSTRGKVFRVEGNSISVVNTLE